MLVCKRHLGLDVKESGGIQSRAGLKVQTLAFVLSPELLRTENVNGDSALFPSPGLA